MFLLITQYLQRIFKSRCY